MAESDLSLIFHYLAIQCSGDVLWPCQGEQGITAKSVSDRVEVIIKDDIILDYLS